MIITASTHFYNDLTLLGMVNKNRIGIERFANGATIVIITLIITAAGAVVEDITSRACKDASGTNSS